MARAAVKRVQVRARRRGGALRLRLGTNKYFVTHFTNSYPAWRCQLQFSRVSPGVRTRTLRGAVCGVVAAAVWALEQPLDKRLLDSAYDDVEWLG